MAEVIPKTIMTNKTYSRFLPVRLESLFVSTHIKAMSDNKYKAKNMILNINFIKPPPKVFCENIIT